MSEAAAVPTSVVWFLRCLRAFVRREMVSMAGYRTTLIMRGVTFLLAVVSLVFFARFVGAAANPHLQRYGGATWPSASSASWSPSCSRWACRGWRSGSAWPR